MDVGAKHVVITGAANGIGLALANRFHDAGARVVLADLDAQGALRAAALLDVTRPGTAFGLHADVATEQGNIDLIDRATARFGPIDLFFANAGTAVGGGLETPEAEWELAFAVNTHAHRWAAKHLVPMWLERGEGYFCSTASAAGLLTRIAAAPYSLTKHAAVAFAEWLAITYGDQGIRVSCLCPQGVNTDMLRTIEQASGTRGASIERASGGVLEPEAVAEIALRAIASETFLIAPHPEVLTYWARKVADYDRWLAGMRRLQARSRD
ncbi:MAG: SDR family oxidoreductase [Acidimicrobiales bacterium]